MMGAENHPFSFAFVCIQPTREPNKKTFGKFLAQKNTLAHGCFAHRAALVFLGQVFVWKVDSTFKDSDRPF